MARSGTRHGVAGTGAPDTTLLIVGAGPFGLAMAAHARALGIAHVVVGRSMSFWREHMPEGMVLRSGCEWHLDPGERDTIVRFLATRGQTPADAEPLALETYLAYAAWFESAQGIRPRPRCVDRLDERDGRFDATLNDGTRLTATSVLLALGFGPFAHVPDELAALVPSRWSSHTRDCAVPAKFAGRRVLVVGGRQSAFETAALLAEAGARAVHVCHRHPTPAFAPSDWSWLTPLLDRIATEPGWYRSLSSGDRAALDARFWAEGRLKLEPWLGPRLHREAIGIRPGTRLVAAEPAGDALRVRLDPGGEVEVDHVLYATGYKADLARVACLAAGSLRGRIAERDGVPMLDDSLQTSVPGLFVTSLLAARDFGLFFAFTAAARASARIVGRAVALRQEAAR